MQTGILFAMERPVIIALTKIDLATPEQVRRTEAGIHSVLKLVFEVAGMREETLVNPRFLKT